MLASVSPSQGECVHIYTAALRKEQTTRSPFQCQGQPMLTVLYVFQLGSDDITLCFDRLTVFTLKIPIEKSITMGAKVPLGFPTPLPMS